MICRNCGAGLEADGIDTSLGIITCSHCGSLHDIPEDGPRETSVKETVKTATKPQRIPVELPGKFKVNRASGALEVTWPTGGTFQALVISIIAGTFAYVGLTSGLPILLIASVGIFYFAAGQAFNEHRIRVDTARLEVTQGPVPWRGSKKLDASDIVQLYATEHERRTQSGKSGSQRVSVHKYYRLSANTRNNGRVSILGGLSDPRQALWLEQEIERVLGIADKPVAGEHVY